LKQGVRIVINFNGRLLCALRRVPAIHTVSSDQGTRTAVAGGALRFQTVRSLPSSSGS